MKRISYSILLLLTLSCERDLYENIKHPRPITSDLFYSDSGGNLYLKVVEKSEKTGSSIEIFFDDVQVNDSTILPLKDVVDLASFRLMDDQDCFYRDKNYIYAYQQFLSVDHPLKRLDLEERNVTVVGDYIFDDDKVYWLGSKLEDRGNKVRDSLVGLMRKGIV